MVNLLEQNYRIFTWLSICSPDPSASQWIRLRNLTISLFLFSLLCLGTISSLIFIVKYYATNLTDSFCTGLQLIAAVAAYTMATAYVIRDDISTVFTRIREIYNLNKERSKHMLKAHQTIEWVVDFYITYFPVAVVLSILVASIGSVVYSNFKFGFIDTDLLYRPYKFVLPWNQNTIAGWAAEIVFSVCTATAFVMANSPFLLFFMAICEYHHAFSQMFEAQIKEADPKRMKPFDIKKILSKSIEYHILVKSSFELTAQIYSTFILAQLIGCMIHLTCCIFAMDMALQNLNVAVILMLIGVLLAGLTLFLFCLYGKYSTDSYAAYADHLYESNWMDLPIDLQKSFVVMIAHAQKPLSYHGYNLVDLNLQTFTRILKTVITYYLMFKTMTSEA